MRSALYEGTVRHRRLGVPFADEFRHRLFMAYLDLDELPEVFDGEPLWSARRPAPVWFRRADHLGDPRVELSESVRALVLERTGRRPEGPIRLLTHLRCLGHCFNPVSFYYCFAAGGEHVSAVLAHVTNTPWGESHSYVVPVRERTDHGTASLLSCRMDKQLHVSPLMGMSQVYELRMTEPAERLAVHISSAHSSPDPAVSTPVFDATLSLARRELTRAEMGRMLRRYPLQTVAILARIYTHAARLRLRGAPYHPRPRRGAPPA